MKLTDKLKRSAAGLLTATALALPGCESLSPTELVHKHGSNVENLEQKTKLPAPEISNLGTWEYCGKGINEGELYLENGQRVRYRVFATNKADTDEDGVIDTREPRETKNKINYDEGFQTGVQFIFDRPKIYNSGKLEESYEREFNFSIKNYDGEVINQFSGKTYREANNWYIDTIQPNELSKGRYFIEANLDGKKAGKIDILID
jgi:hypothetical protein